MHKKRLIIALIIIVNLTIMTVVSNASTKGVITGETVKLRKGPNLESGLVTLLSVDNKVEVLSKEGDWYKVKYKDNTGYVYADYIKVSGEVKENSSSKNNLEENTNVTVDNVSNEITSSQENAVSNNTVPNNIITNNSVELPNNEEILGKQYKLLEDTQIKILPLINTETVEILTKDSIVTVEDEANGWVFVSTDLCSGWLRMGKLVEIRPEDTKPVEPVETKPEEKVESQESKVGFISASSVNVREGANTSSKIITTLTRNAKVTIENVENGWAKIKTEKGTIGYVSNEYISDKQVKETNRTDETREHRAVNLPNVENKEATTASVSNKGQEVVQYAKTLLGKSYVYGAEGPNSFDCSGFTKYVYKKFGINLAHSATAQSNVGRTIKKEDLQLGDMVFFSQAGSPIGHVGIFVGNNSFIHAANLKKGVVITSLSDSYYLKNYKKATRVL